MIGMSLDERCATIKRKFPSTHVTIYKLRKLYKKMMIRKKVIRFTKLPNRIEYKKILRGKKELEFGLRNAIQRGFRII